MIAKLNWMLSRKRSIKGCIRWLNTFSFLSRTQMVPKISPVGQAVLSRGKAEAASDVQHGKDLTVKVDHPKGDSRSFRKR
jgi:hypothetical protein